MKTTALCHCRSVKTTALCHCRSDDSLKIVISRVDTTWNSRPVRTAASIGKSPRQFGHYVMHLGEEASSSPGEQQKTARRSLLYNKNNTEPTSPKQRHVEMSRPSKRKARSDSSDDEMLLTPKRRHLQGSNGDQCQRGSKVGVRDTDSPRKTPSRSKNTGSSVSGTMVTPSKNQETAQNPRTPTDRSSETTRTPSRRTSLATPKTPSGELKSHGSGTPKTPSGRTTSQKGVETPRSSKSKPSSMRSSAVDDRTPGKGRRRTLVSEVVFQSDSTGHVQVESGETRVSRLRPRYVHQIYVWKLLLVYISENNFHSIR